MKFHLKPLFVFLIFAKILIINLKTLTPLSECVKGRITPYTGWENGGKCNFIAHNNATGNTYLYPAAPNLELFVSTSHCGACYEMVGPNGAIRVRVEDYCPKDDELGFCSGDMYHFNVANNGTSYIMGASDNSNINFRMVECGFSGNVRILTDKDSDIYWISFVVLDHNLPITSVSVQENESNSWKRLSREESNYWTYETFNEIYFPIKIRIYSIDENYVTVEMNDIKGGEIYEADSNFNNDNKTFYNITTFEKEEKPDSSKNCCEFDLSDFSNIYKNGEVNELYYYYSQKVTVDLNSSELHQNNNTINAKFQSNGKLVFQSSYPIRADQFSGVSIYIKATKNCTNCMCLRAYDLQNKNQNLELNTANGWKIYRFDFGKLGVENNEFNGIVLYYKSTSQPFEIYIGRIDLLGKAIKPDAGICLSIPVDSSGSGIIPPPIDHVTTETTDAPDTTDAATTITTNEDTATENLTDSLTDESTMAINTTEVETDTEIPTESGNETSLTNVNILTITSSENMPLIININCESFQRIENENIILLFVSNDNSNTFQTRNCNLGSEKTITQFSCILPNNMPNGVYSIKSPSNTKYSVFYPSNALVNEGAISFNYSPVTIIDITEIETQILVDSPITNSTNSTIEETQKTDNTYLDLKTQESYEPIVITSNFDQTITPYQLISFEIEQIEESKFNLLNDEIIFEDVGKAKALYFKSCQKYSSNGRISSLSCLVSSNVIRGNYTELSDGQNISIQSGNSLRFTVSDSEGGMITQSFSKNYTNITSPIYPIIFQILYYNSSVKPGNLFPHKVYLLGNKGTSSRMRTLEEYEYKLLFPNCTAFNYSDEDKSAIGNLRCNLPNYIPAGTYSKLQSDGFDVSPNSKLNIVFDNDYNASNFIGQITSSSSSNSKTWIIWLVLGILLLIVVVIIICACIANSKGSGDNSEESSKKENSKANLDNTSQDKSN